MTHATKRGVSRSTVSARQKVGAPSLSSICTALDAAKSKYQLDGHCRGARILIGQSVSHGGATLTFVHPTKRSTAARYAFLRTSHAALKALTGPTA